MKRSLGFIAVGVAAFAFAGASVTVYIAPWRAMTKAEMTRYVAALYRYGAVDVPQQMAGKDHPLRALMLQVAQGQALSVAQSAQYRRAIQAVLAEHQTLFRLLDNNIVFATDVGPNTANNCGSFGIMGRHDLHSASAASNFAELEMSLAALPKAGFWGQIRSANRAYKSVTDLMVHLAPAAASVMQANQPDLPPDADPARAAAFDSFRRAMTKAGFSPIGSDQNNAAVAQALSAFSTLALSVQTTVTQQLSPLQQRLAGRWLAPQSISPRLEIAVPVP